MTTRLDLSVVATRAYTDPRATRDVALLVAELNRWREAGAQLGTLYRILYGVGKPPTNWPKPPC